MADFQMSVGTRRQVWNGTAKQTDGGLMKGDLVLKNGRIKSRKAVAAAEMRFKNMSPSARAKFEANIYKNNNNKNSKKKKKSRRSSRRSSMMMQA